MDKLKYLKFSSRFLIKNKLRNNNKEKIILIQFGKVNNNNQTHHNHFNWNKQYNKVRK